MNIDVLRHKTFRKQKRSPGWMLTYPEDRDKPGRSMMRPYMFLVPPLTTASSSRDCWCGRSALHSKR